MQAYFEKPSPNNPTIGKLLKSKPPKEYNKPAGIFVTLSTNGKTRGCWGSVYPAHTNIAESTIYATIGALTKDYRFKPIKASEWKTLKPQVTVIEEVVPIDSIRSQNPLADGLMLRSARKSSVILPGEAIDATFQLLRCKLKAGLRPGEPYQLYRLKAEIYE
jgi:AMMECR1 domain-containing protein